MKTFTHEHNERFSLLLKTLENITGTAYETLIRLTNDDKI